MFFAVINLGPAAPVLWLLIGAFALASIVASLALLTLTPKRDWQGHTRGRRALVWLLVWAATFALWGSAVGQGGPAPEGGLTGYTHGGILQYLTVTSNQPGPGAEWSHDVSVYPAPLVGTVALSVAVLIVVAYLARWRRISA